MNTVELKKMREERAPAVETSDQEGIDITSGLYSRKLFLDLLQDELIAAVKTVRCQPSRVGDGTRQGRPVWPEQKGKMDNDDGVDASVHTSR